MSYRTVPAVLLAAALGAADAPSLLGTPTVNLTLAVANPADVARGLLFVSSDNGATWSKAADVPASGGQPVAFTFTAPGDGTYIFKTAAIFLPGKGAAEPEPVPGSIPPNTTTVTIDATPPRLTDVRAAFQETERGSGPLTLNATWSVADAHPGASRAQVSLDEGRTWTDLSGGDGRATGALTLAPAIATVYVRVMAEDLAGNRVASGQIAVAVPAVRDPEAELRQAVTALPAVSDLLPPELPKAAPAADPKPAAPTRSEPPTAAAASGASAPPPAAAPARTIAEARTVAQVAPPAAASAAASADPLAGKPAVRNPPPELPTRGVAAPFLVGDAAQAALAEARALAAAGDAVGAMTAYLRLHESDVAKTAVAEELALARSLGAWQSVIDVAAGLPPELLTDVARVEWGGALSAIGRDDEAIAVLAKVSAKGPQARRASLLLARALRNAGKAEQAQRIFSRLATGADDVAAEARAELPAPSGS